MPLEMHEGRHDGERQRGEHDARDTDSRALPTDEACGCAPHHVRGKQQEADTDDPEGTLLRALTGRGVAVMAETPQRGQAAHDFDRGVESEADERDAPADDAGGDGDEELTGVPRDRRVLEPATPACDACAIDHHAHHHNGYYLTRRPE